MLALVAGLALLNLIAVLGFLRYLAHRDAADRQERRDFLNRIQVPERIAAELGVEPQSISPFDDEAMIAHQREQEAAAKSVAQAFAEKVIRNGE